MDKNKFWEIIANNREKFGTNDEAFLDGMKESMHQLPPAEIAQFFTIFETYLHAAYLPGLWEASSLLRVGNAGSDDSFIDFRSWLISQGRDAYYNAMANPDSMADLNLPEPDRVYSTPSYCELELFYSVPDMAYEEMTGENMFEKLEPLSKDATEELISDIHTEPYLWEQHTSDDMPRLFPKLTKRAAEYRYFMEPDCGWNEPIPRSRWGLHM